MSATKLRSLRRTSNPNCCHLTIYANPSLRVFRVFRCRGPAHDSQKLHREEQGGG